MKEWLRPIGRSPGAAALVVALAPAVATLAAFPLSPPTAAAASVYFLAVVVAAWAGGIAGGVVAAVLSATALNFFFTPPAHTLRVEKPQDVVALIVFLLVALIVGSLVAHALADRARATQRERETRLLNYFATKLLSGEPLQRMLDDFTAAMLEPFALASCTVEAHGDQEPIVASTERPGAAAGERVQIPLMAAGAAFGTLMAVRRRDAPPPSEEEMRLLEGCAQQAAAAIERARLSRQAEGSRLDAEANQLRAALFSSVSHDLRTPLSSIKASVTSLLDEDAVYDPAQRRDLLQTVLEETDRLNRVVGNILDLAKARAGAMAPAKEPTAVDEIVESVLHRMSDRLGRVRVRTALREDLPEIHVDPVQLDQVITNLLENAARFSPPGGEVLVSVAPWRGGVQVRIADEGPGVPPEERERVFEPFYRRDDGHRTGSGLGLAISRAIVLAHGGRIWLEGTPAGGTAVVFDLPSGEPPLSRTTR
jgi:two-component system sensor histidine kinase KdpD